MQLVPCSFSRNSAVWLAALFCAASRPHYFSAQAPTFLFCASPCSVPLLVFPRSDTPSDPIATGRLLRHAIIQCHAQLLGQLPASHVSHTPAGNGRKHSCQYRRSSHWSVCRVRNGDPVHDYAGRKPVRQFGLLRRLCSDFRLYRRCSGQPTSARATEPTSAGLNMIPEKTETPAQHLLR